MVKSGITDAFDRSDIQWVEDKNADAEGIVNRCHRAVPRMTIDEVTVMKVLCIILCKG
jgi:hypothetical protein